MFIPKLLMHRAMIDMYCSISRILSKFGKIVLAGGAVRDCLMNNQPRDWDFYIMGCGSKFDAEPVEQALRAAGITLLKCEVAAQYSHFDFVYDNCKIQVMCTPYANMQGLVESFDWNICLFGFDGNELYEGMDISDIKPGGELWCYGITNAKSTARRGLAFRKRFHMNISNDAATSLLGHWVKEESSTRKHVDLCLLPHNGHAQKQCNCDKPGCPICQGGLFVCGRCGAAECEIDEYTCDEYLARKVQNG